MTTKTKRRVMTWARLDEISAVDKPAQPDARVVLRKRHSDDTDSADLPLPAGDSANNSAGDQTLQMTPEQILALQKRAERAEKALKLNPAEREIFLAKSETDQDAFLLLDEASRLVEVQKAASSNPVVFTDSRGRQFRKNDDPRMVELAKDADEDRKARLNAERLAKMERVSKKAAELAHLPGESADHVLLVEAVEKLEADQQGKVYELLSKLDAEWAKAFAKVGTTAAPSNERSKPEAKIESLAKALREKNPKLTEAQAWVEAMQSPEGREAYSAHIQS